MSKLRVLVVADCESLRRSLVLQLASSIDVAGAVTSKQLPDAVRQVDPEVVVCSMRTQLTLPDPDVLGKAPGQKPPVVFVTTASMDVGDWLDHGSFWVVNEIDLRQDLIAAVHAAATGEAYFSRRAVRF
jgi:DNA-binding NarL/FixJ family response regulator